ncbi:hypothetical protein MAM1_0034d02542 [Mucor ambiguus]|uniref:Uncharacterized protein n=1 Tax=Mucor ambiguus TaxID=91626 RepID=A0A0C9M2Q7_9FUNG|nr:hypothetical protein MAM1_0034d02542 [Mucor ambiguus]
MATKSVNFINKTLYFFSIVGCLGRMVLGNSAVRYTSAQKAAPDVPEQARKRKQLHYPILPPALPSNAPLPIPSKLRCPSAHSGSITSHAAVITTSATDDEPARKRTKTDLKKSLQIAVVAAFKNISKRKYKCVPWLSLFDDIKMRSLDVRMVGWSIDIFRPVLGGKTSSDVYNGTDSLEALLQGFQNKTIIFEKN